MILRLEILRIKVYARFIGIYKTSKQIHCHISLDP